MKSILSDERGTTLIELLLAMTLFTSVMVIATVGFIGMNRVFTRGVIRKELSESSQRTTEEITRNIRNSGLQTEVINCSGLIGDGKCQQGLGAVCMDGVRYYWSVSSQPNQDSVSGGLYRDAAASCKDSPNPSNRTVIVDERFKVRTFSVEKVDSPSDQSTKGLYRVAGVLTAGAADAFNGLQDNPFNITCKGSSQTVAVRSCSVESFRYVTSSRRL